METVLVEKPEKEKLEKEKKEFMDRLNKLIDIKDKNKLEQECNSLQKSVLNTDLSHMHNDIINECSKLFAKFNINEIPAAVPTLISQRTISLPIKVSTSPTGLLSEIKQGKQLKPSSPNNKEKIITKEEQYLNERRKVLEGEQEPKKNVNLNFDQEW
jgi:hypothetical protein